MSTPAHALIAYGKALFILLSIFTALGVFISRVYVFYESYSLFSMQRSEESWLRAKCKDPEFYTNMRQHTDLCAQIEHRALQWIFLHSVNQVFTNTHICGERPCIEYINDLVVRGVAWPAAVILCIFVVTIPSIITSMASRSIWHASDRRARSTSSSSTKHWILPPRLLPAPPPSPLQQSPDHHHPWATIHMNGNNQYSDEEQEQEEEYLPLETELLRKRQKWNMKRSNNAFTTLIGEFTEA